MSLSVWSRNTSGAIRSQCPDTAVVSPTWRSAGSITGIFERAPENFARASPRSNGDHKYWGAPETEFEVAFGENSWRSAATNSKSSRYEDVDRNGSRHKA